jgi:hypothetical protein
VTAGRGDLERALRLVLAAYVGEIGHRRADLRARGLELRQRRVAREVRAHVEQRARRMHRGVGHQRRLRGARMGQHERAAVVARREHHRERAAHGAQLAGERELAGELVTVERRRGEPGRSRPGCRRRSAGRSGRFLRQVGGREIDGNPPRGNSKFAFCNAARTRSRASALRFRAARRGSRPAGRRRDAPRR